MTSDNESCNLGNICHVSLPKHAQTFYPCTEQMLRAYDVKPLTVVNMVNFIIITTVIILYALSTELAKMSLVAKHHLC